MITTCTADDATRALTVARHDRARDGLALSLVKISDAGKRLIVGRKLRSTQMHETLLPKRIALPVFASDPLSSVAYSPDEIFLTLALAGAVSYSYSWKIGIVIAFVMLVVVASYRQNVQAYQSGGGDYEVATTNLGSTSGLTVASALLVDYVLTVAVSISSAAQYAATAFDPLRGHQVAVAAVAVVFLMAMNLRGVRESGTAFAIPTYLFMTAILGMAAWGFGRHFLAGGLPAAPSADLGLVPEESFVDGFTGLAVGFLLLRAFASGCATLTGVEAIANGVPAFRKPKGKNAATTLLLLGVIATTMALSIVSLANITGVRVAENPSEQLLGPDGNPVGEGYHQDPVVGQLAEVVFDHFSPGFYLVTAATGIILVLAANTAFNGFPVLGSILARDGYLPRQLHTRGDRLAYSNGIVLLAGFAIVLIVAFDAEVTRLIQLYIVGVFVSFTASQAGMVRHWTRHLRTERNGAARLRMQRSRSINAFGLLVTATVLVVVLITKFLAGAWIAILAMLMWFALMKAIHRHYARVSSELEASMEDQGLPSRIHAVVLVSKLHKPTMRALAYARAGRANVLEAITVDVDDQATMELMDEWDRREIPVPLRVLSSPYREVTRPIVDYVQSIRRGSPRDVVTVYIPEYVVGHWWEQVLHNQSALRLKGRLLFTPGVMVTSVPYQLASSAAAAARAERAESAPTYGRRRRGGMS
ncbi:MAG: amino acid permease [Propionibacteriales bacterium]|nr:amino acid permease [Propionibacteriales bacterium]